MYISDYHMHTSFSEDSNEPMENMIKSAIDLGMKEVCITEHMDIGYPANHEFPEGSFLVNTDAYLYDLIKNKEKYADNIEVNFGIEIGLQLEHIREIAVYAKSFDFDFIIGSLHLIDGVDPVYPEYFDGKKDEEVYRAYLEETLKCVKRFHNFDVLGHLTYIIRYGMNKDKDFSYDKYKDVIDKILETLIDNGNGIELNTAAVRKGCIEVTPGLDVIKKYKELGGEIITIGSDAHAASDVGADFELARQLLIDAGFKYYTTFSKRSPRFSKL